MYVCSSPPLDDGTVSVWIYLCTCTEGLVINYREEGYKNNSQLQKNNPGGSLFKVPWLWAYRDVKCNLPHQKRNWICVFLIDNVPTKMLYLLMIGNMILKLFKVSLYTIDFC